MNKNRIIALFAFLIAIAIVAYPEPAYTASLNGLKLWFEIVLPALLPFFAMADILMGLGVVHFIGALLEPIMRPLFRIPGVGAFAVAMGLAGGYPIGARITGELHRKELCTRVEAERLVSFSNTADPLFMVGAVAVGMFGITHLGVTLVIAHYSAAVLVGFLMRFYKANESDSISPKSPKAKTGYFTHAVQELDRARKEDGRSFGELFGDTVRDTFASMLFIGGAIMMFSVLIEVLTASGIMAYIAVFVNKILALLGIDPSLSNAVVKGIFETTIGAEAASVSQASLAQKAMIASFVIGWSGFSVHSQVAAMIQGTKIRMLPYLMARLLHGIFAAIIAGLLFGPASEFTNALIGAIPVFQPQFLTAPTFTARLMISTQWAGIIALGSTALGGITWLARRVMYIPMKRKN